MAAEVTSSPASGRLAYASDRSIHGPRAVVAGQHPTSALAGLEVLAAGGNVVDAAVAAAFGAAVGDVGRTGIGGYGGHIVYREAATGKTWLVDGGMTRRIPLVK